MRIVRNSFVAIAMMGIALSAGLDAGSASAAPGEGPGHHAQLTDEQRQCLADQGLSREGRPDGKPSPQQMDGIRSALAACGIAKPERLQLTDEQKKCLSDAGFTRENRPEGERSGEKNASARAAFEACGISRR
ncbi:MAG: hypothetical protein H5T82_07255 [Demequina sp.]|nr:hypothetical protein [Demequina sp.]